MNAAAGDTTPARQADSHLISRLSVGAVLTAICFGGVAISAAVQPDVDWTVALTPAAVAVCCVILVIALLARVRPSSLSGRRRGRR
jgi:hypothetical protein